MPPAEAQLAFLTSAHNQKHSTWKNPSRFSSSATVIPFPAYCSRLLWLSWPKRKNTTTYTLFFFFISSRSQTCCMEEKRRLLGIWQKEAIYAHGTAWVTFNSVFWQRDAASNENNLSMRKVHTSCLWLWKKYCSISSSYICKYHITI